jgi:tight adherence protein B
MHILVLAAVGELAVVGAFATMMHRAHAVKLSRLEHLLGADDPAPPSPTAAATGGSIIPTAIMGKLRRFGIEPRSRDVFAVIIAAGLCISGIAVFFGPVVALGIAAATALIGYTVLNVLAARRTAELGELMPGFFDRVCQLLAIGNSLPMAFARAVQGSPPLLAGFFAPALRRVGNGASFTESIQQSADDVGLYEMRLFAAAVTVNSRFGGSLSHALNNLVFYLRKRAAIVRELRASTAQIRASAWVLGLLPMLVAGAIILQNHDYARWFVDNPTGRKLLIYCIVSQLIGAFLMRAVVVRKF